MCYGTNRVELTGRVVRDIELKKSGKGDSYCFFTLALDGVKSTDFIEVKAFGVLAEDCVKHARKGVKVSCLGAIRSSKYEKDGKTEYRQNVILTDVVLLNSEPVSRGIKFETDMTNPDN